MWVSDEWPVSREGCTCIIDVHVIARGADIHIIYESPRELSVGKQWNMNSSYTFVILREG